MPWRQPRPEREGLFIVGTIALLLGGGLALILLMG